MREGLLWTSCPQLESEDFQVSAGRPGGQTSPLPPRPAPSGPHEGAIETITVLFILKHIVEIMPYDSIGEP